MTDQTANTGNDQGAAQPTVQCHTQYVKDLSFENPNALQGLNPEGGAPDINVNVQIGVQRLRETLFEVTLTVEGRAVRQGTHLFVVELQYCGLFTVENVPTEHVEAVLYIHCPSLLFPFARQILADVTRNGGYPPLLLNPVDFAQLYQQQQRASAQPGQGGNGAAGNIAT